MRPQTNFEKLKKDDDFTDVTLACEDGQQVKEQEVILATSSEVMNKKKKKEAKSIQHINHIFTGLSFCSTCDI